MVLISVSIAKKKDKTKESSSEESFDGLNFNYLDLIQRYKEVSFNVIRFFLLILIIIFEGIT